MVLGRIQDQKQKYDTWSGLRVDKLGSCSEGPGNETREIDVQLKQCSRSSLQTSTMSMCMLAGTIAIKVN